MKNIQIDTHEYFYQRFRIILKKNPEVADQMARSVVRNKDNFFKKTKNKFYKIEDDKQDILWYWIRKSEVRQRYDLICPFFSSYGKKRRLMEQSLHTMDQFLLKLKLGRVDFHGLNLPAYGMNKLHQLGYEYYCYQMELPCPDVTIKKSLCGNLLLEKMTLPQFRSYCRYLYNKTEYLTRGLGQSKLAAKKNMRKSFYGLAPKGHRDKNNYFFNIVSRRLNKRVGVVWLVRSPQQKDGDKLFIAELKIDELFRGQGHAKSALFLIDRFARKHHFQSIELNVFDYNAIAKKLYSSHGYQIISSGMYKVF